jgi:sugar phosphate permease
MSMGYLAIIILRNKPSDVGFSNFNEKKTKSDQEQEEESENLREHFDKIKKMLKFPYFLSICICFFFVQLIKTLYSDWSQIYLNKTIGLDPFKGKF